MCELFRERGVLSGGGLPPPLAHSRFTGTFSVRAKAEGRTRREGGGDGERPRSPRGARGETVRIKASCLSHLWRRFRLRPRGWRDGKENHRQAGGGPGGGTEWRGWRVSGPPPCCKQLQVAVQWRRRRRGRKGEKVVWEILSLEPSATCGAASTHHHHHDDHPSKQLLRSNQAIGSMKNPARIFALASSRHVASVSPTETSVSL